MKTAVLLVAALACASAGANTSCAISGLGTAVYLAAGVGLPLMRDGSLGREHALRAADAGGASVLLAYGLKALVHERRPDGSDDRSFPSAHATAAFAVATMQARFHPREALLWYAGAALIGESRIQERKHHPLDVLAGAGLGFGMAKLELSLSRGLILQPFIGERGRAGLALSGRL